MNPSIIGIIRIQYEDWNVYGFRGTGASYAQLYNTLESKFSNKYVSVWTDFPWHFIRFKHEDAQTKFDDYIHTTFPDDIDDRGTKDKTFEEDWPLHDKFNH